MRLSPTAERANWIQMAGWVRQPAEERRPLHGSVFHQGQSETPSHRRAWEPGGEDAGVGGSCLTVRGGRRRRRKRRDCFRRFTTTCPTPWYSY